MPKQTSTKKVKKTTNTNASSGARPAAARNGLNSMKVLIYILILAVVVAATVVAMVIIRDAREDKDSDTSMNMSQTTSPVATNMVQIKNGMFTPTTITVKKGTTVTWTNNDTDTHNIVADATTMPGPKSSSLTPGQSYSYTYNAVGTFGYHCTEDAGMQAKVIVTE